MLENLKKLDEWYVDDFHSITVTKNGLSLIGNATPENIARYIRYFKLIENESSFTYEEEGLKITFDKNYRYEN